jgi:glycerol-3-phosphate acyltransferase PlsY
LKLWKYVSIASTSAAITGVVISLVVQDFNMTLYYSILMVVIIYRHIGNYKNIKNGIEPTVSWI